MLMAFVTRNVMEATMHMLLKAAGYDLEDDDWLNYGTRYKHRDTGDTMVIPSPFNIGRRILGKIKKQWKRSDEGLNALALYKAFQGDAAVLPKVFIETFIEKKKWDGSPIFDKFDSAPLKATKQATYAAGRIFAITNAIGLEIGALDSLDSDYAQRRIKQLEKLGTAEKVLRKFLPIYMGPGDNKLLKLSKRMNYLGAQYQSQIKKLGMQGKYEPAKLKKWQDEYLRQLTVITDEIAKEQGAKKATSGRRRKRRLNRRKN
jgi:hypothetical protein